MGVVPAVLAKPLADSVVMQAAARIDGLINTDLSTAKLKPSVRIEDSVFLRRAYLGIIGRIPSADEADVFFNDPSQNKRDVLIDHLVASPGFDSHLFNWVGDLLRLQTRQEQFGLGWHVWLRKSLAQNKPWDVLVSEMLTSSGHASTNPAVGYYLRDRNMQLDNFSNTVQVFLGRQIGCAQCHDHPFDDWTQHEYYEMAAFGGGIQYRSAESRETIRRAVDELASQSTSENAPATAPTPAMEAHFSIETAAKTDVNKPTKIVKNDPEALKRKRDHLNLTRRLTDQFRPLFKDMDRNAIFEDVTSKLKLPADYKYKDAKPGEVVEPETLFGPKIIDVAAADRRSAFAAWVISPDNPYFTKAIANRLWQRTFGYTLLGTRVDDLKDDSETFHPQLVVYLETTMKEVKYDLRQYLRILYHTQLFQRECLTEEPPMGEPLAFRGPLLTRMSAEQIYDSFLVLTRGNVKDTPTTTLAKAWADYRKQVENLLHAPTNELVTRAEFVKQGEIQLRKAQVDLRAAQKRLPTAATPEDKKSAQADLQAARDRYQVSRDHADPLQAMESMQSMQAMQSMHSMEGSKKAIDRKSTILRASEMSAPFNPGTMVREFGGSDRQTPSSGNTAATVPQALSLMNDYKTDILAGKKSELGKTLAALRTPESRLDRLFLTFFSQHPSDAEKQRYLSSATNNVALHELATAMLTSNRFIFIQ